MNTVTIDDYVFQLRRMAVGLEPLDALRGGPLVHPVRVDVEGPLPWIPKTTDAPYGLGPQRDTWPIRQQTRLNGSVPRFDRNNAGRHILLYQPGLADRVNIRLYDHDRWYIPRRFGVPIMRESEAEAVSYTQRVRHPVLFAGAAGDVSRTATGLRGRALRDTQDSDSPRPIRWARIEARLPESDFIVGRAQGDDQGEFLLLLSSSTIPSPELTDPIHVRVRVHGPTVAPLPDPQELPELDAYWDLPLEQLPAPGLEDNVSTGLVLPTNYINLVERTVPFRLGKIISRVDTDNDFVFVP